MTKPTEQPKNCNCIQRLHLAGAILCPDCADIEQQNRMNKPELEKLDYKPASAPPEVKRTTNPIIEPEIRAKNSKDAGQHFQESLCRETEPEQPNQNAMIFTQVNGCIEAAERLLEQLVPKTEQVGGCIVTLKSWQDNNLKHLQKAFGA